MDVDKVSDGESAFAFAEGVARPLVAEAPDSSDGHVLLAEALIGRGDVTNAQGKVDRSEALFAEAVKEAQAAVTQAPQDVVALDSLSRSYSRIGALRMSTGRSAEAVEPTKKSLEVDHRLAELQPNSDAMQVNLGISTAALGDLMSHLGQIEEARKLNDEALGYVERVTQRSPDNAGRCGACRLQQPARDAGPDGAR